MAMTKKEQAAMNAAIERAEMLAALRWTAPVERDVPIPELFGSETSGWDFNKHSREVFRAWSGSVRNGFGAKYGGSASQGGRALFSTRQRALAALRYAMECEYASALLRVDKAMAGEHAQGNDR